MAEGRWQMAETCLCAGILAVHYSEPEPREDLISYRNSKNIPPIFLRILVCGMACNSGFNHQEFGAAGKFWGIELLYSRLVFRVMNVICIHGAAI